MTAVDQVAAYEPREFVVPGEALLAGGDWGGVGEPAVLLHGLNGTLLDLAPLVPLIEGMRCVGYDLRGHGKSDSGEVGIERQVSDMLRVFDFCGFDRALVIGSSFGAVVALVAAGHHPDRIRAMVSIEGPVSEAAASDEQRLQFADNVRTSMQTEGRPWRGTSAGLDARIAKAIRNGRHEAGERRRYHQVGHDRWEQRPDVETAVDMVIRGAPAPGVFERIACPVLALVGATSTLLACTPDARQTAAAKLAAEHSNFEVAVLPGGHDLVHDVPQGVAAVINTWTALRLWTQ